MADYFVHEKAIVDSCSIGKNTRVWAFTHIMKNVIIGENCNIGEYCFIEDGVKIGNDVTIKNGISLWDGVSIEDNVFLGPHAVFTNDLIPRSKCHDYVLMKTIIRRGASIGANATIICGVVLGEYSMIGAGSVVTKNVPDFVLVYGNPAQSHGYVCECGQKLTLYDNTALCSCGKEFRFFNNKMQRFLKE